MPPAGKKTEETLTAPKPHGPGGGGGGGGGPVSPGQYRFIGDHAQILESGQPLGHGDYVTLQPDEITGINQMLIDDGNLIDASDIPAPPGPQAAEELDPADAPPA